MGTIRGMSLFAKCVRGKPSCMGEVCQVLCEGRRFGDLDARSARIPFYRCEGWLFICYLFFRFDFSDVIVLVDCLLLP